jgi:hypothetical protein
MAVGNGEMLVAANSQGDISIGDCLISSDVAGCAMKDDAERFPVGYVIARAAGSVRWSDVAPGEDGVRRATVPVLFESFVRNSEARRLAAEVSQLASLVAAQREELESMRAQLADLSGLASRPARLASSRSEGAR